MATDLFQSLGQIAQPQAQPAFDPSTMVSAQVIIPGNGGYWTDASKQHWVPTPGQPDMPGAPGAPSPNLPPQTPAPASGASPFAGLLASMPQSGFARPQSQTWLQQVLGSAPMQGWDPQAANGGGAAGGGAATPTTPSGGVQSGTPYTFSGEISPEAMAAKKQIKKARKAGDWSIGDLAKIAGAAALTYATGGSTAGILASAAAGAAGQNAENGAANGSLEPFRRLKKDNLTDIGWTQTKDGGWRDASGAKMNTAQIVQTLMNMGAWG